MPLQVTTIMLGVRDLNRSKQFYGEGLGCTIDQDHPTFVSFNLGDGSSSLALYQWDAAAQDAGVSPEGSGFRGVSFHFIVASREAVDEVMGKAVGAGGSVVKEQLPLRGVGTSGTSAIQMATCGRSPLAPEHPAAVPRKRHAWRGEWDCTVPPTAAQHHPLSTLLRGDPYPSRNVGWLLSRPGPPGRAGAAALGRRRCQSRRSCCA